MNKPLLALAFLACLGLSYARSYHCLHSLTVDNDSVLAINSSVPGNTDVVSRVRWLYHIRSSPHSYEPVPLLLHWLIYSLGARGPEGFRWLEIVLLAVNALFVCVIGAEFVRQKRWALLAGLVYLLHPMHNDNWSSLSNSHYLATVFILAGFYLHLRSSKSRITPASASGLAFLYLFAALSKESGVIFPLFLLSFDVLNPFGSKQKLIDKRRFYAYAGLLAVALFYLFLRVGMIGSWGQATGAFSPSLERMALRLLEALRMSNFILLLPPLVMLPWLLLGKKDEWLRLRKVAFCVVWFILGLFLVLTMPPLFVTNHIGWRYLFLPFIAVAWLAAISLDWFSQKAWKPLAYFLAVLLLGFGVWGGKCCCKNPPEQRSEFNMKIRHCMEWMSGGQGEEGVCRSALLSLAVFGEGEPGLSLELKNKIRQTMPSDIAETILGYYRQGSFVAGSARWRYLDYIAQSRKSIEGLIDYARGLRRFLEAEKAFERGNLFLESSRPSDAVDAYRKAVVHWPEFAEAHLQEAKALCALGDREGALKSFKTAMNCPMENYQRRRLASKLYDSDGEACGFSEGPKHLVRASGFFRAQKSKEGFESYHHAVEAFPFGQQDIEEYCLSHGNDCAPLRRAQEQIALWNDKGIQAFKSGDHEKAGEWFKKVLELDPKDISALLSRGAMAADLGHFQEAVSFFDQVVRLKPFGGWVMSDALSARANVLAKMDHRQEAISDLEQSLRGVAPGWPRRAQAKRQLETLKALKPKR